MSKNKLKFGDVEVNKREFHASKHPIAFNSVDIDKIVIFDKFKHSNKGAKYFISYKDDDIIRHLCIILVQMSRYVKYLGNDPLKLKMIVYW